MSEQVQKATLLCGRCGQQGEHQLVYAGRILTHTQCGNCGHVVHPHNQTDLPQEYVADLKDRLRTKPRRLARRASKHPGKFLVTLPKALLRQPSKFIREFRTVRKEEHDKDD